MKRTGLEGIPFCTKREMKGWFRASESFGDLLPYRDYDPATGLFLLGEKGRSERHVGAMYEFRGFVHDANSLDGQRLEISGLIESALLKIPEGYAFQFIVDSDRNVGAFLPPPLEEVDPESDLDLLYNEQLVFLHRSAQHGLWDKKSVFPRLLRFYIFVFPVPRKATLGERAVSALEREELESALQDSEKKKKLFTSKIALFESSMKSAGFHLKRCAAQDLIDYFFQLLHKSMFKEGVSAPSHLPGIDLSEQVLRTFLYTDYKFVYADGHYYRSSAATNAPGYVSPCIMYRMLGVPGDIHLCLTGYVPVQDKERSALRWKGNFAAHGLLNPFGREDNNNAAILADIDLIEKEMLRGKKMFHFAFTMINIAESYELANSYANKAKDRLADLEMPLLTDNIISQSLFKGSLPFHYAPLTQDNHLYRTFKLPSHYFSQLAPSTGSWLGTQSPAIVGLTRTCEPAYLDFFDGTVPHFLISGDTGTGKSAFFNLLLPRYLKKGAWVFIIDPMGSFTKSCTLYGGERISFDLNDPVSYNPFVCELDKERLVLLSNFLASIMTRADEELSLSDTIVVERAIELTFEKIGAYNEHPELEDFNSVLKAHFGEQGKALSERLGFYVGRGKYSNFFRRGTFDLTRRLTLFDISGLRAAPDLMRAILYNIMLLIGERVRKLPGMKILGIDEVHTILSESMNAEFVENALRTYRHHHTAVGLMMQKISDPLKYGRVGEVILTQPNFQIFFHQPRQSVLDVLGYLELMESDAQAVEELRTVMGYYSEAFIHAKKLRTGGTGKGVFRFLSTPLNYAAFTSDPPDKDVYGPLKEEIRAQQAGATEREVERRTLREFARRYPHGVATPALNPEDVW
ncbi:MAG: TraC family protein [Thermodesulfovibrionales bacterium]